MLLRLQTWVLRIGAFALPLTYLPISFDQAQARLASAIHLPPGEKVPSHSGGGHGGGPDGATSGTPPPNAPASVMNHSTESLLSDAPGRANRSYSRALVRKILREAAARHGVDARLVLAMSYWESGWDQTKVSDTGAIGLMQVEPATSQEAAPALLGRNVDIEDPYDNADVGVAVFREDLPNFKDPAMALAAYYQGPTSLREYGMLPDTQQYVEGILDLSNRLD